MMTTFSTEEEGMKMQHRAAEFANCNSGDRVSRKNALPGALAGSIIAAMSTDFAVALHERLFTIDTHIDTPTGSLMRPGWDFGSRHDPAIDRSQCDLPRMREGGIDALVFAVYIGQMARSSEG